MGRAAPPLSVEKRGIPGGLGTRGWKGVRALSRAAGGGDCGAGGGGGPRSPPAPRPPRLGTFLGPWLRDSAAAGGGAGGAKRTGPQARLGPGVGERQARPARAAEVRGRRGVLAHRPPIPRMRLQLLVAALCAGILAGPPRARAQPGERGGYGREGPRPGPAPRPRGHTRPLFPTAPRAQAPRSLGLPKPSRTRTPAYAPQP